MKYYIIAGEASGDLHASNLMAAIRDLDPAAVFRCWGGDRMESEGGELVKHYRDLDYMGFTEVLCNIRSILGNFRLSKRDLMAYKPDVLILVDYPGFNLPMSRYASNRGIPTAYYISPQIWAWKQSRVRIIRRFVDRMLVILPFERDFYASFGVQVTFTGHPLIDAIEKREALADAASFRQRNSLSDKPVIALLPGSRKQEISRMLKIMVDAAADFPTYQFVIAAMSAHPPEIYRDAFGKDNMTMVVDQTYALLRHAEAAVVTSGTATLETALFDVPQVVCYKTSPITYYLARRLVRVPYISLVNLVMKKAVITELIQGRCNRSNLTHELNGLLYDSEKRLSMLEDYRELRLQLGGKGASNRAAAEVVSLASGK